MTLRSSLKWRNLDSTKDLNDKSVGIVGKGVVDPNLDLTIARPATVGVTTPLVLPVPGNLQVEIIPFQAVTASGMMVFHEGADEFVNVTAGIIQYVLLHGEYVSNASPITGFEVLSSGAYAALTVTQKSNRIILAKITLGGGATEVLTQNIDLRENNIVNSIGRPQYRGSVANAAALPDDTGGTSSKFNVTGDQYLALAERQYYQWNGTIWQTITDGAVAAALAAHIASITAHAASSITNTPAGNIAATNVQAALNELDAEKVALASLASTITPGSTLVGVDAIAPGTVPWDTAVGGTTVDAQLSSLHNVGNQAFIKLASQVTPGAIYVGQNAIPAESILPAMSADTFDAHFKTLQTNANTGLVSQQGGQGVLVGPLPSILVQAVVISVNGTRLKFIDNTGVLQAKGAGSFSITIPSVGNGVYIGYYDAVNLVYTTVLLSTGIGVDCTPFFVVVNDGGGAPAFVYDARKWASRKQIRDIVTVGPAASGSLDNGADFHDLQTALMYTNCFNVQGPKVIHVVDDVSQTSIAFSGAQWGPNAYKRLSNISIEGHGAAQANVKTGTVRISWSGSTLAPMFDFTKNATSITGITWKNIEFYCGASWANDVANLDLCFFKNITKSFQWVDCVLNGNDKLTDVFYWNAAGNIGGGTAFTERGLYFIRTAIINANVAGSLGIFLFVGPAPGSINGSMNFVDSLVQSNNTYQTFVLAARPNTQIDIVATNSAIAGVNLALVVLGDGEFGLGKYIFDGCELHGAIDVMVSVEGTNASADQHKVLLTRCLFESGSGNSAGWDLQGAYLAVGCAGIDDGNLQRIRGNKHTSLEGCDFYENCSFDGDFQSIADCRVRLHDSTVLAGCTKSLFVITGPGGGTDFRKVIKIGDSVTLSSVTSVVYIVSGVTANTITVDISSTVVGPDTLSVVGCLATHTPSGFEQVQRTISESFIQKDGSSFNRIATFKAETIVSNSRIYHTNATSQTGDSWVVVDGATVRFIGVHMTTQTGNRNGAGVLSINANASFTAIGSNIVIGGIPVSNQGSAGLTDLLCLIGNELASFRDNTGGSSGNGVVVHGHASNHLSIGNRMLNGAARLDPLVYDDSTNFVCALNHGRETTNTAGSTTTGINSLGLRCAIIGNILHNITNVGVSPNGVRMGIDAVNIAAGEGGVVLGNVCQNNVAPPTVTNTHGQRYGGNEAYTDGSEPGAFGRNVVSFG